jgi:L-aminopeptidase/D-esterase-like protein
METITDIPGIRVGHCTNREAATGCTVILCEQGAVAGVDVRGAAPGTRETDLLRPMNLVREIHAILLSGGSAFGLDAAGGIMRYLEERGYGHDVGVTKVPIVPAAILFDLGVGDFRVRPGAEEGYQACLAATNGEVEEGSIGVGTGATVGKALGMERATKSGVGMASQRIGDGVVIAALMVVNSFGDIVDPETVKTLAGPRQLDGKGFLNTAELLKGGGVKINYHGKNTVIGVVATNAVLDKERVNKLAQVAHDGIARTVRPPHTMFDGDTIFALSLAEDAKIQANLTALGAVAVEVVSNAILRGITEADSLAGIPAVEDLGWEE